MRPHTGKVVNRFVGSKKSVSTGCSYLRDSLRRDRKPRPFFWPAKSLSAVPGWTRQAPWFRRTPLSKSGTTGKMGQQGSAQTSQGTLFVFRFACGFGLRDIGASTGDYPGSSRRRARKVYAVDVGYGQLAWSLRNDERVVVMERTNARALTPENFRRSPTSSSLTHPLFP